MIYCMQIFKKNTENFPKFKKNKIAIQSKADHV